MMGTLMTGGVGLVSFALVFLAQVLVRRSTPAHLGAEAFGASLIAYPVLGLLCGVVCAFFVPWTAPWRTPAVLALANPATYGLLAYGILGGTPWLGMMAWVWVFTAVASAGGYYATSRLRQNRPAHLCAGCGYDLTGNVSGTCPECGRVINREPSQRAAAAPVQSILRWRLLAHFNAALEALILGAVGFAIAATLGAVVRTRAVEVGIGGVFVDPLMFSAATFWQASVARAWSGRPATRYRVRQPRELRRAILLARIRPSVGLRTAPVVAFCERAGGRVPCCRSFCPRQDSPTLRVIVDRARVVGSGLQYLQRADQQQPER